MGLGAAEHYARLGASRLILAVRTQAKGDAAKQSIVDRLASSSLDAPEMDVWLLDLASFASVRALAQRVAAELPRLDVAVLNAAVLKRSFAHTADGWEESMQINALATVLLGLLILPKMESTADAAADGAAAPRLQFVASEAHTYIGEREAWLREPRFYEALNKPESWSSVISHYAASKLFLVYCVREMAARVPSRGDGGHKVVVNYSCPGACQSDLTRDFNGSWWERNFVWYLQHATFYKTAEEGGRTLVYATCLGEESHGKWIRRNGFDELVATP